MAIGDIIVGIDIGTSKVSTFVGEVNNFNQIEIICSTSTKCQAVQKGKIVQMSEIQLTFSVAHDMILPRDCASRRHPSCF